MIILQINAVNGIKSTGRMVKELDDYLKKNGDISKVAYSIGPSEGRHYRMGTSFEKKIHAVMSRITGLQGYFSSIGTFKLLNYINKMRPDVVHLHNLHSNYINIPMLFNYLAKKNIATVITLHDCWFYTGGHTHYVKNGFYDWENGFSKKNRNKHNFTNKSWFFDRSEKIFKDQVKWVKNMPRIAFVGVSKWITEEARKSKVTRGSHLQTIYNWIDLDIFQPNYDSSIKEKLNIQNKFVVLSVASVWSNNKGLDKFLELSKHLNSDECILLVGEISGDIELPKNVINIPETHDIMELVRYYSIADVFVNLSMEESFGKVSAEALACGTPVITIDSTANAELVGDGCGYVIEQWDVFDVIKGIHLVRTNGKYSYSDACINYAIKNFSSTDNLNQYLELYEKLIFEKY